MAEVITKEEREYIESVTSNKSHGFVNSNIGYLKNKPIDPNSLRNQDFIGVQATKGSLGTIIFTKDEVSADGISLSFPLGALRQAAKVGILLRL